MTSERGGRTIISLKMCIKTLDLLCVLALLSQAYQVTGTVTSVNIVGPSHADENSDVSLRCDASCNNGTCARTWLTGGLTFSSTSSSSVTATSVVRKVGGKYTITCSVKDNNNVARTDTHTLDVYYGPDSATVPSSLTIQEGKKYSSTIQCTAANCHPGPCTFKWTKGSATKSSNAVLFSTSDTAARAEAGTYTCTATSGYKASPTSKTRTFALTVQYAPDVSATWSMATKTLKCNATGVPTTYTFADWTHTVNGVTVRDVPGGTTSGGVRSYTFPSMSYMDRGKYTCKVNNGITPIGATNFWKSDFDYVKPDDKPVLVTYHTTYNVSKGAPLVIELTLYANPALKTSGVRALDNSSTTIPTMNMDITIPPATVTTKFHGVDVTLSDGQKAVVNLHSVEEGYFGNFNIEVDNGHGTATYDIILFPEGAPDPPVDVQIKQTSHDAVTLTFRSGFFNGADQTFVAEYKVGNQWRNGSDVFAGVEKNVTWSITVSGLNPETFYQFRCYGYNIYKRSEYADVLINATTLEEPQQLGLIIGASVGGVVAVAMVIGVVIAICWWRRKRADDKQAINRESASSNEYKQSPKNKKKLSEGKVNNVYVTDEPAYENTTIGNGVPAKQPPKTYHRQRAEEPLYSNQTADSMTAGYGGTGDHTDNGEDLIAKEGYLDLERQDDSGVEEAYITKGASKPAASAPHTEEEYINLGTIKDLPKPKPHNPGATSHYLNVSKQIGLIGTEAEKPDEEEESNYLDMEVTKTPIMGAKRGGHKTARAAAATSTEGTYVAMSTKGGVPVVAAKPMTTKKRKQSPYQNMNVNDKDPSGKPGHNSGGSPAPDMRSRDSMPSFHAPAPPSVFQEEDYENIKLG